MITSAGPSDWREWCNLADAAAKLGRWSDAASALQRAAALNRTDAAIVRNLGAALSNNGRFEEALAAYETAVRLDPDNLRDRLSYARLLYDLGGHREAIVQVEEGLNLALKQMLPDEEDDSPGNMGEANAGSRISPDRVADVRDLGLLLDRLNQGENLRRLLAAAESKGIEREMLASLWASVAFREGRLEETKCLLLQDRGYFHDAHWDRLMTKTADALGESDKAFAAAEAMNRATPGYDQWRRRAAHYRSQIRATARIVTPEWGARIRHAGSDDGVSNPAFVVGFPRSGTTLLDTFLMGHPETCVIEEGRMLELATEIISEAPGADWPPNLVRRARKAYLDELSQFVPPNFTGLIVDKHPLNMLRLAVLHAVFPGAKVIFAQRHPCDVVLSGYMQSFHLNHAMASFLDLVDAADLYDAAMTMWTLSRDAVPQAVHSVVYERLIADAAAELKPALAFLGLDWRDELLDHQSTAKRRGLITTASYDQVVRPLSREPSGRWHRYEQQLAPVLPVLLPWAERLGYPRYDEHHQGSA